MKDYDADAKKNGITDGVVTLRAPKHLDVVADRAYVVVPADYTYKQEGKEMKQTSSILTVALHKGSAGWRITGAEKHAVENIGKTNTEVIIVELKSKR
jgi:hypothetical protein